MFGKLEGQWASDRVLSPDQIFIGGVGTVRGFPISEFAGDHGYNLTVEYIIPLPWKIPLGFLGGRTMDKIVSVFGFIDHGEIFVENAQPGESGQSISGAGGGLRINIPRIESDPALSFNLSYAVPVFGSPDPTDGSSGTVYVGGVLSW